MCVYTNDMVYTSCQKDVWDGLYDLIMRKVKQFLIFLLVVITIYSTLLFYLLMSVHADSRLQQIDFLQRSKFQGGQRVIYMDKIMHLNDRFHHFTISLLRFNRAKPAHCKPKMPEKALLIICASSFDFVTIYMKLLREMEMGVDECSVPEVFILKRIRPLVLSSQQNINKYAFEIGQIIKYMTIEGEYEVSIFTHEEGALLTLTYFTRRAINLLFTNIVEKIRSLVLVDLTHPFMRVMHDPPYRMLARLKREIFTDPSRVKIFNRLKIVVINTYKEDEHLSRFQFSFGQDPFVFSNTVLVSSREMANVHYYLPQNSLSFPPFVRRIGQFVSKDLDNSMEVQKISHFFRYGQSYGYEVAQEGQLQDCSTIQLQEEGELLVVRDACAKLGPFDLKQSQAVAVYSPQHFQMFTQSGKRLYPFDNLTEGSIFLLESLTNNAYIVNPGQVDIHVFKQHILTPRNPLPFHPEQLFFASQVIFSKYWIVSVCPRLLLLFPIHFSQGNAQRKFLASVGDGECFMEDNILQEFSWQFFLHWSLFRNLIVFTLLCSEYRKQRLSQRLIEQFLINLILLLGKQEVESKFFYALYIVSFGLLVEYLTRGLVYLCGKMSLRKKWINTLLLVISGMCLAGSAMGILNVWGFFLLSMLFFLNNQNVLVTIIKLYFLKDDIWHSGGHFHGLSEIGLLTMWIYTSLPSNQIPSKAFWTAQRLFSGLLVAGVGFALESSGCFVENMVTIYMKVLIVVKMLRIIRK